jgi:predicted transcriptional regulator
MATTTFSVRADEEIQRALSELGVTPDGRNRSQIVRAAILTAAKEARRAALRAETAALANNGNDRAELRAVQDDLDPLRAW